MEYLFPLSKQNGIQREQSKKLNMPVLRKNVRALINDFCVVQKNGRPKKKSIQSKPDENTSELEKRMIIIDGSNVAYG